MKIFLKRAFGMGTSYASKDGSIISSDLYPTVQTQNVLNNVLKPENRIVIDGLGYKTDSSKETATMTYSLDSGVGSTDSLNKLTDSIKSTDASVVSDLLTSIGIDKTTALGLSKVAKILGKETPLLGDAIGAAIAAKELQDGLKEVRILNSKALAIKVSDAMTKFKMVGGQIQVAGEFYMSVSPTEKTLTMINRYNQITGETITFDDLVDEKKLGEITQHIKKMKVIKGERRYLYSSFRFQFRNKLFIRSI